jgi:hypothetical protein
LRHRDIRYLAEIILCIPDITEPRLMARRPEYYPATLRWATCSGNVIFAFGTLNFLNGSRTSKGCGYAVDRLAEHLP